MNSSLGDTLGASSGLAMSSPVPSGRLTLPARPSTSAGFTSTGLFSTGGATTTGKFEPERVVILGNVPVATEPAELAAALGKRFGPLCYVSIQPSDDGSDTGWAIATFVEHGPSASASAKGSVVLEISTPAGPPEEFGLDEPVGQWPTATTTVTLPIDKLAFKVSKREATRAKSSPARPLH